MAEDIAARKCCMCGRSGEQSDKRDVLLVQRAAYVKIECVFHAVSLQVCSWVQP